jgi:hypothetical protein
MAAIMRGEIAAAESYEIPAGPLEKPGTKGVAHDFNNLLMVVLGNLNLCSANKMR